MVMVLGLVVGVRPVGVALVGVVLLMLVVLLVGVLVLVLVGVVLALVGVVLMDGSTRTRTMCCHLPWARPSTSMTMTS